MTGVRLIAVCIGTLAALTLPDLALAHLERPSYWPDPNPDRSVTPAAGGEVPKARSLGSAVTGQGPGQVRVVCQGKDGAKSLRALNRSLRRAREDGYRLRPSLDRKRISRARAKRLRRANRRFARDCEYESIQAAVNDSGNNDRIVIMPGRYREPASRPSPLNDPKCADMTQLDASGAEVPSYKYQVRCPNDQNLIYVQGRKLGGPPPAPPLDDRHGIPDEGECVRCNLQIEGSGVKPEDVILDAGKNYDGPSADAKPGGYAKQHVVLRVDRADGFVGRNMTMRGGYEFGFYTEETDGILLDRTKFFWNRDYGHLSFTSDHHVVKNCEGFGSGDAAVYPGAAPETGSQARRDFYPDAPRVNTVIKRCDLHGNVLGYSGSMSNAVRITKNHIYGNAVGISSDTISASGHPGYPADSIEIDHNFIYSNNLHLYGPNPQVQPIIGVLPVGTGIFFPGHNDSRVHDNWIFDNWRFGTQLLAIPDAVIEAVDDQEPEGAVNAGISCPTGATATSPPPVSTSCGNLYYANHMGLAPPDFEAPKAVFDFGNNVGGTRGVLPNGVDFWWDEFAGNIGNCWRDNTGPDGTAASVTGPGPGAPPDVLPGRPLCDELVGPGDAAKELYLFNCFNARLGDGDPALCDWYDLPPRPGTAAARDYQRDERAEARESARSEDADRFREYFDELTAAG